MTRGEAVSRVDNDPLPACPHGPRPVIRSGIASLEILDELKVIEIEVLEGTNALADGPVEPGHDRIVAPEIECRCEHRRVGMDGRSSRAMTGWWRMRSSAAASIAALAWMARSSRAMTRWGSMCFHGMTLDAVSGHDPGRGFRT